MPTQAETNEGRRILSNMTTRKLVNTLQLLTFHVTELVTELEKRTRD